MTEVDTVCRRTQPNVWKVFPKYEKLLWSVVWKWIRRSRRLEPEDLFSELVLIYHDCYCKYPYLEEQKFISVLYSSAYNKCVDIVVRESSYVPLDDGIWIHSDKDEFQRWFNLFMVNELLETATPSTKAVVVVLLNNADEIYELRDNRNSHLFRNRQLSRRDLEEYLCERKGWKYQTVWRAFSELNKMRVALTL